VLHPRPKVDRLLHIWVIACFWPKQPRAPHPPPCDVQRRGRDPPSGPWLRSQTRPSFERPGECLLRRVICEGPITAQQVDSAEHRCCLRLVEPLESGFGRHSSSSPTTSPAAASAQTALAEELAPEIADLSTVSRVTGGLGAQIPLACRKVASTDRGSPTRNLSE